VSGLVHEVAAEPSRVQLNVAGVIVEWNVNVALVLFVGLAGLVSMTVSGAFTAYAGIATAVTPTATSRAERRPPSRAASGLPDSRVHCVMVGLLAARAPHRVTRPAASPRYVLGTNVANAEPDAT
jgi:hypothetical protein